MEDSTMTEELRKLHTLFTQLEMKIAICQKRYTYLDKILRKHDSRIRDVLLTVLIEIVDEEPCGSRRILLIGFFEEMLNILNAAEVLHGEYHQRSLLRLIWH
ncbi:hypothetical protein T10_13676 [Trichinella papuae]|uniref:Uncharacterized protein n=1 Tax=Trichinella papuae TaxID=268474 RepID=A0A0V1MUD7_9BILA|nr:hypothetical protein T10_13676 [Trichinella papuae]